MTFESYQTDLKTKSAVERQMQIMTEAAVVLAGTPNKSHPGPIGKVSAGPATYCDTLITELTTK